MLIDATHAEETRVVVLDGNRLEDFDVETSTKKQLKGNIYLAKVVRVEPSLQAAIVEYGGWRHGFQAFGEIHPDYYQIPVADRQRLLALQAEEARAEEEAEAAEFSRAESRNERYEAEPEEAGHGLNGRSDHVPSAYAAIEVSSDPDSADAAGDEAPAIDAATAATIDHIDHPDVAHGEDQPSIAGGMDETSAPPPIEPESVAPPEAGAPQTGPLEAGPLEAGPMDAQPLQVTFGEVVFGEAMPDEAPVADLEGEGAAAADDMERMRPPEMIGGENDTSDGFGADQARVRSASRILRNYRIQEVIRRRQILLIQVVKEERGTKGAALTTYISLAGRFCVLMPNSPRGGGISRKITSSSDRRRLKEITAELEIPKGMGLIVRTAGAARPKPEIRRDCEYLMRLWDDIREHTMQSMAPALIYEEASLIKRAIRDVYSREVSEILVDGEDGWRSARDFMRMLMPDHAKKVQLWRPTTQGAGGQALFAAQQVEAQLDAMNSPTVQLKSGGYVVINQTEALVAIDVNSGRSTRERGIEETALKTNLEAADEVARQLRLRDLAGLIVIDFIDMESRRNNTQVEKRIQDALKVDRARIQIGHISAFGLLEMSRQRLRPSLAETSFVPCPHCGGSGHTRSVESSAIHVLRAIEEECGKMRGGQILVHVAGTVAMYLLNHKRDRLSELEERFVMRVHLAGDDSLPPPQVRVDRVKTALSDAERPVARPMVPAAPMALEAAALETADEDVAEVADEPFADDGDLEATEVVAREPQPAVAEGEGAAEPGRGRRRRRRGRGARADEGGEMVEASGDAPVEAAPAIMPEPDAVSGEQAADVAELSSDEQAEGTGEQPGIEAAALDENGLPKARRRGRRGGRRRRRDGSIDDGTPQEAAPESEAPEPPAHERDYAPAYVGPTPADPFGARPFDIYDLMDEELPPLDIPPVPVVTPLPTPPAEPSTLRAADVEPTPHAEPLFEPQPEPAPPMPEGQAEAIEPETPTPQPEIAVAEPPTPEPPTPAPEVAVYAPVLVGASDVAPAEPKRGWWKR